MKIKVCGLNDPENIKEIVALQPDYMGFIFYKDSPRYIDGLNPAIMKGIDSRICKTGVFVNESLENINALIAEYALDAVQLHGVENPEFCRDLKSRTWVIKAFGINEDFDFSELRGYTNCVDYFLFDTKSNKHGGTGLTFDWSVLNNYKYDIPFFLSGGLSPENIEEALKIKHPQFYGVDLNSKFEISPGIKDIDKLRQVFKLIRENA